MKFEHSLCSLTRNSENTRWSSMSVPNTVIKARLPVIVAGRPRFSSNRISYLMSEFFLSYCIYETALDENKT